MNRRDFIAGAGAGLAGVAAGSGLSCSKPVAPGERRSPRGAVQAREPLNLLFIMTDQQRWDALSAAGNGILETPNLDRLAREGVYFENAYTNCPISVPARAVILTAQSPGTVRVERNVDYDRGDVPDVATFDSVLAGKGRHAEYYGKWHTPYKFASCYANKVRQTGKHARGSDVPPQARAYVDWLDSHVPVKRAPREGELIDKSTGRPYTPDPIDWRHGMSQAEFDERMKAARRASSAAQGGARRTGRAARGKGGRGGKGDKAGASTLGSQAGSYGCVDIPAEYTRTAFVAGEVLDALDRMKDGPFALTCSFGPPHPPLVLPRPYYGMYPATTIPVPASIDDPMENSPYAARAASAEMRRYRDAARVRQMISNYYGLVKEVDDWVGRILARLERHGLAGRTFVVFTSDHGEMLGDHGMHSKMVFYEGSAHVPLMMRLPDAIRAGTVVSTPVSHVDLFDTILDYAGVAPPGRTDGRSLRPLIEGRGDGSGAGGIDFCVSEWPSKRGPNYMVRSPGWKLVLSRMRGPGIIDALYNLEDDPHEMTNLIGTNPGRRKHARQAEAMKARLVRWLEHVKSPHLDEVKARPVVA